MEFNSVFKGLKGQGCQFDHLPPSNVENYKTQHHFYVDLNMDRYIWGPPILLAHGYCASFPGVKQRGCVADLSLPHNADVKNECSSISILPRFHGADNDNFTFL